MATSDSQNYKIAVQSKWSDRNKQDGRRMMQTVYHIPNGVKKNGKPAVMSITRHEAR